MFSDSGLTKQRGKIKRHSDEYNFPTCEMKVIFSEIAKFELDDACSFSTGFLQAGQDVFPPALKV
jgi:hypothetical protein